MADSIETAIKTDITSDIAALKSEVATTKSRMLALESEAAGYVKVHIVWFAVAISLIVGAVAGHVFR